MAALCSSLLPCLRTDGLQMCLLSGEWAACPLKEGGFLHLSSHSSLEEVAGWDARETPLWEGGRDKRSCL